MKKTYLLLGVTAAFTMSACANDNNNENNEVQEAEEHNNEELETALETVEDLRNQLDDERERTLSLESQVADLYEENMELKDDLLTYRQEMVDQDADYEEVQAQQQMLQDLSLDLFQAMHEGDEQRLEEIMGEEVEINAEEALFVFSDEDTTRSFHFIQLGNMNFSHLRSADFDEDEAVREYKFYEAQEEELIPSGAVEVRFVRDEEEEWKVVSLQYIS